MKTKTLIVTGLAALAIGMAACKNTGSTNAVAQQAAIDSLKMEIVKKQVIDSMNMVAMPLASPVASPVIENSVVSTEPNHTTVKHKRRTSASAYSSNSYAGNASANTNGPVEKKTKKGWSAKAKGAVIGTGAGAVAGAMIDKKKGRGAVIGGLLGAGAGVGVGAILDNKEKKKDE